MFKKAKLGAGIAHETASSLTEIVTGIGESSVIAGEIAKSSDEQSEEIKQIDSSIEQVALVVQHQKSPCTC